MRCYWLTLTRFDGRLCHMLFDEFQEIALAPADEALAALLEVVKKHAAYKQMIKAIRDNANPRTIVELAAQCALLPLFYEEFISILQAKANCTPATIERAEQFHNVEQEYLKRKKEHQEALEALERLRDSICTPRQLEEAELREYSTRQELMNYEGTYRQYQAAYECVQRAKELGVL